MNNFDTDRSQSLLCKTGRANIFQSRRPWIDFILCVIAAAFLGYMLWPAFDAEFGAMSAYLIVIITTAGWCVVVAIMLWKAAVEAREAQVVFRRWVADRKSIGNSFEVRTGWNTVFAWVFIIVIPVFFMAIGWLLDILLVVSVIGLLIGTLGSYLLQQSGTIYADSERLGFQSRDKKYSISWDDVILIETHPSDLAIAFSSGETRIRIPGYPLWSGPQKYALWLFLEDQIHGLNVPVQESMRAWWKNSKRLSKS